VKPKNPFPDLENKLLELGKRVGQKFYNFSQPNHGYWKFKVIINQGNLSAKALLDSASPVWQNYSLCLVANQ
jgi:hypothetical protein